MTNDRDKMLQDLFAEAEQKFDDVDFTRSVLRRTYGMVIRLGAVACVAGVIIVAGALALGLSPLMLGRQIADLLTVSLVEFGEGWAGLVLAPINSVGGALVLFAKGARMLHRRLLG